jgi:hypothetical protein
VSHASLEVQERWTATKKDPEGSILGAYSSLCLRLFCPGDFGVSGDVRLVGERLPLPSRTMKQVSVLDGPGRREAAELSGNVRLGRARNGGGRFLSAKFAISAAVAHPLFA